MTETDGLAALQPIRDRAGIVAKLGPPRPGGDLTNAAHRSAADVPRLLKAAEAALEVHSRWDIHEGDDADGPFMYAVCKECCAASGGGQTEDCAVIHDRTECWPCDTRKAITAALTGKEAGDEH